MHPLLNIAISAARQAGSIVLRFSEQVYRVKIHEKSANDYCSEVDLKAEQEIINTILKAYPNHSILSEERGQINNEPEYQWIIDPLDGTRNYLHGFPYYCVSIAVLHKNQIEHAVIYDPIRHECFSASKGSGARLNNNRIRMSNKTKLSDCVVSIQLPVRKNEFIQEHVNWYQNAALEIGGIRSTGSAALDLAFVASGRLDACVLKYLQSWDLAAGSLIVEEAGGFISDIYGGKNYLKNGSIVAASPKIFKKLQETINQ